MSAARHKISAAVIGASGHTGRELVRWLRRHPGVALGTLTSRTHNGKRYSEVFPEFATLVDQPLVEPDLAAIAREHDVAFIATPHGESPRIVPLLEKANPELRIIDLSDDFRTDDHFVYGIPELNADTLREAKRVANPGCFATTLVLGLYPIVAEDLCERFIAVDSKTGSSGSGMTPTENTHHPERAANFKAYSLFTHRHLKEVTHCLQQLHRPMPEISFAPQSAPMVRGIYTVIHARLHDKVSEAQARHAYDKYYKGRNFIRLKTDIPQQNHVNFTNFCDIGLFFHERMMLVIVTLDNLVKGAAGQAIQNMNLMCGLEEAAGLL